jgi:putative PIN family toxin of toxin-antitoxin system
MARPGDLLLSRETYEELQRILLYPRLLKRSGLTDSAMAAFLRDLYNASRVVVPAVIPQGLLRDPTDEPILGTALAGNAEVLCTRDLDFLSDNRVRGFASDHGIRIVTDLELLAILDNKTA